MCMHAAVTSVLVAAEKAAEVREGTRVSDRVEAARVRALC
jgi:hypothetical protein